MSATLANPKAGCKPALRFMGRGRVKSMLSQGAYPLFFFTAGLVLLSACSASALVVTNAPVAAPSLPDAGGSVIRVFGALIFVIALFLGGVWLFRNWKQLSIKRSGIVPKLNVLEVKSLGQRQAVYVVGYQQQRMLLGSSPTGITLLSHLPPADENEPVVAPSTGKMSFVDALQQVISSRKP